MCGTCGGPRDPKGWCPQCYAEANFYRGRDIRGTKLQTRLQAIRKAKEREYRKRTYKKTNGKLRKAHVKNAIREYDKLLCDVLRCFERDITGEFQIYADRMDELRLVLNEIEWLIPKIRRGANYKPLTKDLVE